MVNVEVILRSKVSNVID